MAFPLLRLPLLASTKIIKNTDIEKIISLIQLSTRARTLVKLSEVHIELTVLKYSIQFQKLDGEEMVGEFYFSKLFRGIQHRIGAYKKVLDDFVECFKVRSVFFELDKARSYTSLCYVKHAENLGLSIARVVIGGSNRGIYWFTVDNMCALVNCSEVFVNDLNWSSEDMNRFLRFWITCDGKLNSLASWKWDRQNRVNFGVVMNGIDRRVLGNKTFEIRRADGVKAELEFNRSGFNLTVNDV